MNFDDLENELRRHPIRPVPPEWRTEILTAVEKQRLVAHGPGGDSNPSPARAGSQPGGVEWREWFWPCPQAWIGLAAIWLALLVLNSSFTSEGAGRIASDSVSPNPEDLQMVTAQRRELARLLDLPGDPAPPKTPPPLRPRSEALPAPKA